MDARRILKTSAPSCACRDCAQSGATPVSSRVSHTAVFRHCVAQPMVTLRMAVRLNLHMGPGDDAELVIMILMPNED